MSICSQTFISEDLISRDSFNLRKLLGGGKCFCAVCVQTGFFLLLLIEYCNHLLTIYILFDTISNPKIIYNTWDVIDRLYANITPFHIRGFNI